MANGKRLCLNMIVKNETANLERCLGAVASYINFWVIGDTGSTDGTQDFILKFFAERGIPGELHSFPFINFAQARNAALDLAHASELAWDYLLLDDADMELVVEDPDFRAKLEAPCYDLLQRSGISYWNVRLVRRDADARYHGVTHEYLAVEGGGQRLHGVWYKDHASGSNRVDKLDRDIRLLTEALAEEPENHRYWFYLAQTYRDAGRLAEAAEAYAKRAEMGGWDEEAWYARLQEARCLRDLNDEGGFLRQALAAFSRRPHRAEPLYDLARYQRERGRNEAAALFAEQGLAVGRPEGDVLFLEDYVYDWGLREELSIAANYSSDPERKARGAAACRWLATNSRIPAAPRDLARHNLQFYPEGPPQARSSGEHSPTVGDKESEMETAAEVNALRAGPQITNATPRLIFIHAAPRTSSTWFWSKFREHPATLCYFEPFDFATGKQSIRRDQAPEWSRADWPSRHPPTPPYFEEYTPLIRDSGGVELFDPAMTAQWFIPVGGLRGELRPSEKEYLSLLLRHADEADKIPVFKDTASLGRCWTIREAFGGVHIFQYRNLWQQWLSYLSYHRQGRSSWFYLTAVETICRDDDPYFSYLVERGIERLADDAGTQDEFVYSSDSKSEENAKLLGSLPEHTVFALFMGLHIYLYLHAQLVADMTVDVTRMARHEDYRQYVEQEVERQTGLAISFADVEDALPASNLEINTDGIDWQAIREYARVAAQTLSSVGDPGRLAELSASLIEDTIEEVRQTKAVLATLTPNIRIAKAEVGPLDPENPRSWWDLAQADYAAGRFAHAAKACAKRAAMGGAPEEVWYARLQEARCLRELGDEARFLEQMLDLINQRPNRAEPLHALARFHRERGAHETAMLFAERGIELDRPTEDPEFIDDSVHRWCLQEEISISGFYCHDPARKRLGAMACKRLASNPDAPDYVRDQARCNLRFYPEYADLSDASSPLPQTQLPSGADSLDSDDFVSQHPLRPARELRSRLDNYPRVLLAILAKQKERPLPLFLRCIEALDYPKSAIFLYIRTNNNTDRTEEILREWIDRVGASYAGVEFDAAAVDQPVEQYPPHEWNTTRFRVLGHIRDISLRKTLDHGCDFYFTCDVDNFIRSCTLRELVALNFPIVAPFLRVTNPTHPYSNFFAKTNAAGFYVECDEYRWIVEGRIRGIFEVPVVHCTYLVRNDVIPHLHYLDGSNDWEFKVFCKSAREGGIPQYLDNRQVYGYLTWDPESNAAKVNVGGGPADQIGFAEAQLEKVDQSNGLNPAETDQTEPPAERELVAPGSDASSQSSTWVPDEPTAGTELMVRGLRERMGSELERVNLQVNHPGPDDDPRPRVVWMHHNVDQTWVQWCKDKALVDLVDCFVFVSAWQRDQYFKVFGLPPERCVVLRNATDVDPSPRVWQPSSVWRCAYTSTPFRGLSVLLDAWERLSPSNGELHIWSSMKLYLGDDGPYNHLYNLARSIPKVTYHGIAPNPELRAALRQMHFLVYPSTFEETSCLAIIEALAAGCRVIAPALGALPETTNGFARIYPWISDQSAHAGAFADILAEEMSNPWGGQPELSLAQQRYCAEMYEWDLRIDEWRRLINRVTILGKEPDREIQTAIYVE
jgi:glycosyltransferase involved in cell wall biosynthesis/tetratricopeptide (TPR) repeat protein